MEGSTDLLDVSLACEVHAVRVPLRLIELCSNSVPKMTGLTAARPNCTSAYRLRSVWAGL